MKRYKIGDKIVHISIPPGEDVYKAIILSRGTVFDWKVKTLIKGEWIEGEIAEEEICDFGWEAM